MFCSPFVGFARDRKSGHRDSTNFKQSDLALCYVHAAFKLLSGTPIGRWSTCPGSASDVKNFAFAPCTFRMNWFIGDRKPVDWDLASAVRQGPDICHTFRD